MSARREGLGTGSLSESGRNVKVNRTTRSVTHSVAAVGVPACSSEPVGVVPRMAVYGAVHVCLPYLEACSGAFVSDPRECILLARV